MESVVLVLSRTRIKYGYIVYCRCPHYTYIKMHNDWNVTMQGHCVSGTIHFGDHGYQKISTGALRFGTSYHPIYTTVDYLDGRSGED